MYDGHAVIQQRMARRIMQTLDENRVEAGNILEVGCGRTGYLTQLLLEHFPDAGLVGNGPFQKNGGHCHGTDRQSSPLLGGDVKKNPGQEML